MYVYTTVSVSNNTNRKTPSIYGSRGWRSWNLFGLHVNQTLMIEVMDAMVLRNRSVDGVPTSLFDLGYIDVGLGESSNILQ